MEATPRTNRSAKGGARSSLHYGGEGVLIHPPHQGVCGRHGTEDLSVTPGGLSGSSDGTEGSDPISASEMGSGVLGVDCLRPPGGCPAMSIPTAILDPKRSSCDHTVSDGKPAHMLRNGFHRTRVGMREKIYNCSRFIPLFA